MAFGNTYSNNQNNGRDNGNRNINPTVYSNYRMNNGESSIDPTCITFSYWKSNLKISIFPRKQQQTGEGMQFDMANGITAYLSHTKARIFKYELEEFLKDPTKYQTRGIPAGQCFLCISNGVDFGKDVPVIVIYKVDESGQIVASFAYEIKRNFHYAVHNFKGGSDFEKDFAPYQNLEIEQIITLLDEYCKNMTNAAAFTVMEQQSFMHARTDNDIKAIAQELKVDLPSANNNRRYGSNSFFNTHGNSNGKDEEEYDNGGVGFGTASIDDLE